MKRPSQTHRHAQNRSEQERILHKITSRIRQSLELQEILEAAAEEVRGFLAIDRVKIYQFYPDGHGWVIAESIAEQRLPSLLGLHFPADDIPSEARQLFITARQRVIVNIATQQTCANALNDPETGEVLAEADIRYRSVDPCHTEYLKGMGVQSSLVIPILHQEALWGLLVAHHADPHDYAEEELQIAQLVADQLSIAIAQATLLTQARNKADREVLINQVGACLHSLTTIEVQQALNATVSALKSQGGRLYQFAQEGQPAKLYTIGEQPMLPPLFQETVLEENILWKEYFRRQVSDYGALSVYALTDLYKEPRLRVLAPAFQKTRIRGLLVVVLEYRQQVLGYLSVFRHEVDVETMWAGQFDPDERQLQPRNSFAAWKEQRRGQGAAWTPEAVELAQALASHFAIALCQHALYQKAQAENQQRREAEKILRRQTEEERLLAAISHRIRQSLSLEAVLDTTVAEVRHFLNTDRVLLYRFDPGWHGVVVAESVSNHQLSILGQAIHDPCFQDKQLYVPYQQGHVSYIENVEAKGIKSCYADLLKSLQVRANLVVPILVGVRPDETVEPGGGTSDRTGGTSRLWGLLIAHNCVGPRQWQSWEIRFLQQLGLQVAIALQQAELYQQLQALNITLEQQVQDRTVQLQQALTFEALLKRITDKVRDSLDEHQILQTAVRDIAEGLKVTCCDAALYDLEHRTSKICYEHMRQPIASAHSMTIEMTRQPELYAQLLSGQAFQFCRSRYSDRPNVVMRPLNQRYAIFCCPMTDDQTVLGDLWVFKPSQDYFNELEVRVIQQVANQCAIALRQARLYQESQAQVEELARLNQLKDDFLSTVSHELRTPMSSIKLATQMLEVILKETGILAVESNKAAQYFQILNTECKREIGLINDLLDLTRLDARTEPLALTAIALDAWISHVAETFQERTSSQGQQLQVEIPTDFPAFQTDLAYLERLLSELLTNACKYTPEGGTIRVTANLVEPDPTELGSQTPLGSTALDLLDRQDAQHFNTVVAELEKTASKPIGICRLPPLVQIWVTNTGVEIPLEERDRIFEKFYRIPNSDPWKHGGTGLGLALVKKMAEYLGGTIRLESGAGQTSFVVILPNLSVCHDSTACSF